MENEETLNKDKQAFPLTDGTTFAYDGLTKQEYACIKLGIPESGDEDIDALIRKSNRMRIAEKAMQGLLSNHLFVDSMDSQVIICKEALKYSDELLKQLNP